MSKNYSLSQVGNILSVDANGTITSLNTSTTGANLGAVGNVHITGGSNGQVLTTNGSGSLSWGNVATGGPAFSGYSSSRSYTNPGALSDPIPFDSIYYNIGSGYNASTHQFVAPIAGIYYVETKIWMRNDRGRGYLDTLVIQLYKNGSYFTSLFIMNGFGGDAYMAAPSTTMTLASGDGIDIRWKYENSVGGGWAEAGTETVFSVAYLRAAS